MTLGPRLAEEQLTLGRARAPLWGATNGAEERSCERLLARLPSSRPRPRRGRRSRPPRGRCFRRGRHLRHGCRPPTRHRSPARQHRPPHVRHCWMKRHLCHGSTTRGHAESRARRPDQTHSLAHHGTRSATPGPRKYEQSLLVYGHEGRVCANGRPRAEKRVTSTP